MTIIANLLHRVARLATGSGRLEKVLWEFLHYVICDFVIIDTPLAAQTMSIINHAFLETHAVVEYCKCVIGKIVCNGALML